MPRPELSFGYRQSGASLVTSRKSGTRASPRSSSPLLWAYQARVVRLVPSCLHAGSRRSPWRSGEGGTCQRLKNLRSGVINVGRAAISLRHEGTRWSKQSVGSAQSCRSSEPFVLQRLVHAHRQNSHQPCMHVLCNAVLTRRGSCGKRNAETAPYDVHCSNRV